MEYAKADRIFTREEMNGAIITLYSEDMQHNNQVRSARIINPPLCKILNVKA
ncbi:MAG: hypothetical protein ACYSR1_08480 [Planctomycetota bacterium]